MGRPPPAALQLIGRRKGSKLPSTVTTLNPNAAEFVPSTFRSPFGSRTVADVSKPDFKGLSGKTNLGRSESSKSNNSDDETHQFWHRQLPDDIIPDFSDMEKVEQQHGELSFSGLSLNAPPFFGTAASNLSREHHGLLSQAGKNLDLGHNDLYYDENSGSNSGKQNHADNLCYTNGKLDLLYDHDPLEYLASQFPGFSVESLAELYCANGCDFDLTVEILTQLEMQVDASSCQNLNLAPNTPNIGTGNFPVLPGTEDLNCLFEGNVGAHGITNRHNSSTMSRTGDFVSAIQRLALQDAGHMKFKNESPKYANGLLSIVARKQYGCDTRSSLGNKFLKANSNVHSAPVSLKTGDAMASMCSESRGEAGDFARIRNTCFEQATQAYMMGNKALAKELSMKGQLYNLQMKAAHETAREAIYQQRNPFSSEQGQDRLIDLHGLQVSEAIQVVKAELALLMGQLEKAQIMICIGTGHHTKGSREARLPDALEHFLLDEGLHHTQP
uniref:Smr domain-containing protein n=1 Tax=Oryza nivara TaxID=4536 RepID=A0A0E0GDM7_ORYNI